MSKNQTLLRTYIYKQRLEQVLRGQLGQTTQLATGRMNIDQLLKQLQDLKAEGRDFCFVTGFLATDQETGKIHQKGDRESFRVGINIKVSADLPVEETPTMGEKFPAGRQDTASHEDHVEWDEGEDSEEIPF